MSEVFWIALGVVVPVVGAVVGFVGGWYLLTYFFGNPGEDRSKFLRHIDKLKGSENV